MPALIDVSFAVKPGETVALVGESGSGKSVTSQAIMGILPANAKIRAGEIWFNNPESGQLLDIAALDPDSAQIRQIRGGAISIIFQEPMTSLSPVHTIGDQISEALFLHRDASRQEGLKLTETMLQHVGFANPCPGHEHVSVRIVRWIASARDDCDGDDLPSIADDSR